MKILRFRVTIDDEDDIYREIDILPNSTFSDLHEAILQSYGFDNKHAASFFFSNDGWIKGEEIVLREEDSRGDKKIMKKCKLSDAIFDPHQKFIYLYDYDANWTFYVELIKIADAQNTIQYPHIHKVYGDAPKQYFIPPKKKKNKEDSLSEILGIQNIDDLLGEKGKKKGKSTAEDEEFIQEEELFDEEEWSELHQDEEENEEIAEEDYTSDDNIDFSDDPNDYDDYEK